ncbi:MAG: 16S rRNA (uracil(1498)-N(3))-methyltransferase [Hyphomicrobium sp.]|nr:MAG: 16S rRNA (uracil(1498)-N(3))-methyltransferase [Hyphomicrobium sp.]PPC99000.1 MAG: 16S rRNA (uracil(1498)-N(3))-methyltransferase [Hyphomicrobium sp.]
MAIHDSSSQRLYVTAPLGTGIDVTLSEDQAHYLINVLRLKQGQAVLIFNGRDGEWRAVMRDARKKSATLHVEQQVRVQTTGPDIAYVFAPLKRSRLDYMVQKATELGVASLHPVITQHTIAERVNVERMKANVIEAAEQCGILRVPAVHDPLTLDKILSAWDSSRPLIFCNEAAEYDSPITKLQKIPQGPLAVLIGPEGGFSDKERAALCALPFVHSLSLGPRIMRADTAAVACLALINATLGDWR